MPSKSKRQLPEDLLKLEKLWLSTNISTPKTDDFELYERSHLRCHTGYEASHNVDVIATLTKSWMKYLEYLVLYSEASPLKDIHNLDEGIKYLTKKKQITDIVKSPENANLLAYVVLHRVQYTSKGYTHRSKFHVGTLLSQWLNETIPKSTIDSLESTVETLYGSAAWSVYRSDVDSDSQIPKHLFDMQLPIIKTLNVNEVATDLDLNISIDLESLNP